MEFRARTLPQWVHLSAFLGEQGDTVFSLTWRMADAATMPKDRTTIEKYGTNPNIWVQLGGYPDSEKETESAPPHALKGSELGRSSPRQKRAGLPGTIVTIVRWKVFTLKRK